MVQDVEDQIAKKQRTIDEQSRTISQLKQESDNKNYELRKTKEDAKKELAEAKRCNCEALQKELAEMKKAQEDTVKKQLCEMKKAEEEAKKAAEEFRKKNEQMERCRSQVRNACCGTDKQQAVANEITVSFHQYSVSRDTVKVHSSSFIVMCNNTGSLNE